MKERKREIERERKKILIEEKRANTSKKRSLLWTCFFSFFLSIFLSLSSFSPSFSLSSFSPFFSPFFLSFSPFLRFMPHLLLPNFVLVSSFFSFLFVCIFFFFFEREKERKRERENNLIKHATQFHRSSSSLLHFLRFSSILFSLSHFLLFLLSSLLIFLSFFFFFFFRLIFGRKSFDMNESLLHGKKIGEIE